MRHSRRQQLARDAAKRTRKTKSRGLALIRGLAAFAFVGLLAFGGYQAVLHPDTPLPPQWNPVQPLAIAHPVTPLTTWKLNKAAADPALCLATLMEGAAVQELPPLQESEQCFIANRVDLRAVGGARLAPLETTCGIALRMAIWERHSLQPAAQAIYGADVTTINQIGSYNCRRMRTSAGTSTRMSTHATADAVDITGFDFSDGRQLSLISDWDSAGRAGEFLRAARDGACDWFGLTLSPDFNSLHADHFHLQSRGWGRCR